MALNPFGEKVNKSTIIVEGTFQEDSEEFFPEYSKRVRDYLVKHDGEVEAIFEFIKSDDKIIRINFEKHGSKALVPEYARLTIPKIKKTSFLGRLFNK